MAEEIVVTSMPDADQFIAELYFDNENVATLIEGKPGEIRIQLHANRAGESNEVDYHDFLIALVTAHKRLSALAEGTAPDA